MNCPRCNVPLKTVEAGGVQVDMCPQCEGSWYDLAELNRMFALQDRTLQPSGLAVPRTRAADLDRPVACLKCSQEMERGRYLSDCDVLVDRCPEHGIWLDGGELKALLDHMAGTVQEKPGLLHALRKLFG